MSGNPVLSDQELQVVANNMLEPPFSDENDQATAETADDIASTESNDKYDFLSGDELCYLKSILNFNVIFYVYIESEEDSYDSELEDPDNDELDASLGTANSTMTESDTWIIGTLRKPVLLKFKGKENVTKPAVQNAVEYFKMLFDDKLVTEIINFTNIKARQLANRNRPLPRRSMLNTWTKVTKEEFYRFLGLCMLMGNIASPSLKHYWKCHNKLYHHPLFGQVMPRNQFEHILRVLRFYDIRNEVAKKDKIQFVLKCCDANFKKIYAPAKQLSIDEALVGFKGRLSYKQYIPSKRRRFGIKLYELTTLTGYILDIILYTGKGTVTAGTKGHAYAVVQQLMKDYYGKGHALYLENYYCSIPLAEYLLRRGVQMTGTIRSNRQGIPDIFKKVKLEKGESFFVRKGNILLQKYFEKREIMMISTRYNGEYAEVNPKFGRNIVKPKAIAEYNTFMGGIDKADQMISYYSSPRKTMRWQLKVFFHIVDLCLWNANYLYNFEKPKKEKLTYLDFRDRVILSLLGETTDISNIPSTSTGISNTPSTSAHYPMKMSKRIRCKYCYTQKKKRTDTIYGCSLCRPKNGQGHIGLCIDP